MMDPRVERARETVSELPENEPYTRALRHIVEALVVLDRATEFNTASVSVLGDCIAMIGGVSE